MGLFKSLTSGSSVFNQNARWYEPWMWEAHLAGTFKKKMITAAIFPAVGMVLVLIISSLGNNPKDMPAGAYAFLGMLFGLLVSAAYLHKNLLPGYVKIGKKEIVRTKNSMEGWVQGIYWEKWPYSAIRQCRIIPKRPSSRGYHILEITTHDGQCDRIAVCELVDLTKLGRLIQSHGISVLVPGGVLPPPLKRHPIFNMGVLKYVLGAFGLVICIVLFIRDYGDKKEQKPNAVQAGVRQIDQGDKPAQVDIPHPEIPRAEIPEPPARPVDSSLPSQRSGSGDELPAGALGPHTRPSQFGPRGGPPRGFRPPSAPPRAPRGIRPQKTRDAFP